MPGGVRFDVRHIEVRRAHRRHGRAAAHRRNGGVLRIDAVVVLDERRQPSATWISSSQAADFCE